MIKFIGYQEISTGERFPLFNIDEPDHVLHQSTVSDYTLLENGLVPPDHPTLDEWNRIRGAAMDLLAACKLAQPRLAETSPAHRIVQEAINKAEEGGI